MYNASLCQNPRRCLTQPFRPTVLAVAILALIGYLQSLFLFPFLPTFLWSVGIAFVIGAIWYAVTHVQYAVGLPGYSFFQTLHFTAPKMQFYDKHLDNAVW